jgi:hypothetical protein
MSEGTKQEYGKKKVTVYREGDKGEKLRLEPSEIDLQDWEWVEWTFLDLKEGEFGFISFPDPPRFGPFYSLRSLDSKLFLGKGNKGGSGNVDYSYIALILTPEAPAALASSPEPGTPGAGKIHNRATKENTAPEIVVTYKEVKNDKGEVIDRTLTVTPDPAGLNRGDAATWLFKGLPPNAFACFKFAPGSDTPGFNTGLGPFLAFNACKGDHDVTVEASAMGFAVHYPDPEKYPNFTYHIELRDWQGNILASHDPMIDNLGPPPQGP